MKTKKTGARCPKCGGELREEKEVAGYPYFCPACDENFYAFEAVEKAPEGGGHSPEPWIWLQDGEATGKADSCACRLDHDHADSDSPAFTMCPLHEAAPELLEALEIMTRNFERQHPSDYDAWDTYRWAAAAIAKAKEIK